MVKTIPCPAAHTRYRKHRSAPPPGVVPYNLVPRARFLRKNKEDNGGSGNEVVYHVVMGASSWSLDYADELIYCLSTRCIFKEA